MQIGEKPFVIAELSGNHNGSLDRAKEMILAASKCGCDSVKIQCYEPEDLCDPANNALYQKSKIPRDWYPILFQTAQACGIPLFSSVFAPWAVTFLERFNCPAYKIASPESTRLPTCTYMQLAGAIRATHKTFMASSGKRDMPLIEPLRPDVLFYCKAGYPAQIDDTDLEYIAELYEWGNAWVGFSDHTMDLRSTLAAIAAGAKVIEKHFKLDEQCVDAAFSFNPTQMETLCRIAHR